MYVCGSNFTFFFFDKLQLINKKTENIWGASSLQTWTRQGIKLAELKKQDSLEARENLATIWVA